jgi:hypothetical protein
MGSRWREASSDKGEQLTLLQWDGKQMTVLLDFIGAEGMERHGHM